MKAREAAARKEGGGERARWWSRHLYFIWFVFYCILYVQIVLHISSFISAAGTREMDLHLIRLFRRMCVKFHWILKKNHYSITKSAGQQILEKNAIFIGFKESWTLVLARISLFVFSRRIFLRRALDEGQVGSKPFNSFLFSKSLSIRVYLESLSLFKSVTDNRFNVKFSSGHRKLAISKAPHR